MRTRYSARLSDAGLSGNKSRELSTIRKGFPPNAKHATPHERPLSGGVRCSHSKVRARAVSSPTVLTEESGSAPGAFDIFLRGYESGDELL
jgi:hypothetical protein